MSNVTVLDGITVDDIPVKFHSEDILTDSFEVDPTLTVSGAAADAKVTGDEIDALKEDLTAVDENLSKTRIDLGISRNLFDKASAENGKYCAGTIGSVYSLSANVNYCALIIDAKPNTTYTLNHADFSVKEINAYNVIVSTRSQTTFTTGENTVKLGLSVTLAHKNEYMIVEGGTLPANYEPYGENLLFETKVKVYEVGSNKTYSSFTACLKALKDDSSKKTIAVYDGTYDIFEEIGGADFVSTITSNDKWRDVSVIVPPNTKIIGVGDVVFEFMPEDGEISSVAANLLSALNVSGNVDIENIKIHAKNCRYCIHDETSSLSQFDNAVHKYKNVECIKYRGSVGYVQAFACGFQRGMKFDFENCYFESYDKAFSMHNSSTGGVTINIKDSVFISGNTYTIELINLSGVQTRNIVNVANCYINRNGTGKKLAVTGTNVVNTFDVTLLGCTDIGDTTIDIDGNLYPIKQYNAHA